MAAMCAKKAGQSPGAWLTSAILEVGTGQLKHTPTAIGPTTEAMLADLLKTVGQLSQDVAAMKKPEAESEPRRGFLQRLGLTR